MRISSARRESLLSGSSVIMNSGERRVESIRIYRAASVERKDVARIRNPTAKAMTKPGVERSMAYPARAATVGRTKKKAEFIFLSGISSPSLSKM